MTRILIMQGHPDAASRHLCHALADAYAQGAVEGGHDVRRIDIAKLDLPLLRSQADFNDAGPPIAARAAQESIAWAEHVALVFPLWLGGAPALVQGFLEQTLRPGFAFKMDANGAATLLKGRSARLVVTMGMPAFVYRIWFRAHGLRRIARSVLGFVGFAPVRTTYLGGVESVSQEKRLAWIAHMRELGARGV